MGVKPSLLDYSLPPLIILLLGMSLFLKSPPAIATFASLFPLVLLSRFSRLPRYYLRLVTFLSGLAACSTWGVVVSVVMSLVGKSKDINWVVARSFYHTVGPLVGMKFTVEGSQHLDENKPCVLIGNHQTMIDILYLGAVFPKGASIMAKKELKYSPLLGQFMTLSNAVFVDRSKRADAVAVFAKVATTMKEKLLSLFIFPEGTRSASSSPTLLPFKKGAFHLAVAAQLPLVPIVCENYWRAYSSRERRFDGGDLVIRVLPPIPTEGLTGSKEDIAALVAKTESLMLEALEDLTREYEERERLKRVFKNGEAQGEGEREPLRASMDGTR